MPLAAELVRRQVAVIAATGGPPSALAAKAARRRASAYAFAGGWRYQSPSRIASLYGNLGWKSTEAKVHLLTSEVDNFFGRDTPEFCHSDYYNAKDCIAIRGYDFPAGLPVGLSPLIRGAAGRRRLCLPDGRRCRSLSGRLDLGFGELAPQIC
jgi:hypothetical protein